MVLKHLMNHCFSHLAFLITVPGVMCFRSLTVNCKSVEHISSINASFSSVKCNLSRGLYQNETIVWSTSNCIVIGNCTHIFNACNITITTPNLSGKIILSTINRDKFLLYIYVNRDGFPADSMESFIFSVFELSSSCPTTTMNVNMKTVERIDCYSNCLQTTAFPSTEQGLSKIASTEMTDRPITIYNEGKEHAVSTTVASLSSYHNLSTGMSQNRTSFETYSSITTSQNTNRTYASLVNVEKSKAPIKIIKMAITLPSGICIGLATVLVVVVCKRLFHGRCQLQNRKLIDHRNSFTEPLIDDEESMGMSASLSEAIPMAQLNINRNASAGGQIQTPYFTDITGTQEKSGNNRNVESDDTSKQMSPLPPVPQTSALPESSRHLFKVMDEMESGRSLVVAISGPLDNGLHREANKTSSIHVYETVNDDGR